MSTPAVNLDEITWRTVQQFTRSYPSGNWGVPMDLNVWAGRYQKQRPESVKVPKRSDGTRGPAGWRHTGMTFREWSGEHGYVHAGGVEVFFTNGFDGQRGPSGTTGSLSTNAVTRAFQAWHENAKDQKVNLAMVLAEARKTVELVSGTATNIAHQVRRFRLRHPRHVWRYLRSNGRFKDQRVTDEYLKMCYGWTPLLGEIDGSLRYLAELAGHRPATFMVVGQAKSENRYETAALIMAHVLQRWTVHDSAMCKVGCLMSIPSQALRDAGSLGLANPLALAWELVPYSFVIDWFLPIGDWANSLDSTLGMNFVEGYQSLVVKRKAVGPVEARKDPANPWVSQPMVRMFSPAKFQSFNFNRTVLLRPPERVLPSLRFPLSLDKLAKGLSLLVGAFR